MSTQKFIIEFDQLVLAAKEIAKLYNSRPPFINIDPAFIDQYKIDLNKTVFVQLAVPGRPILILMPELYYNELSNSFGENKNKI